MFLSLVYVCFKIYATRPIHLVFLFTVYLGEAAILKNSTVLDYNSVYKYIVQFDHLVTIAKLMLLEKIRSTIPMLILYTVNKCSM